MPRLVHAPPKYRLHKASGQAVVTLNGRDHYLGAWESLSSREAYDRLVGEWLVGGRRPPPAAATTASPLVVSILAAYLRFARSYYRKNGTTTKEFNCMKEAMRPVRELYGRTPASQFGPLALKAVRLRMIEYGWARTHINRQVNRVRRIFKWAVAEELVPVGVLHALQTVAGLRRGTEGLRETTPVTPVGDDLVDRTIPFLPLWQPTWSAFSG